MKKLVSQPYQKNARPVWLCNFYGFDGRRKTTSLGTQDEAEAKRIVLDLEAILSNPENKGKQPEADFIAYKPRAVKLALGLDADPVYRTASILLTPSQIETISVIHSKRDEIAAIEKQHDFKVKVKINIDELNTLKLENADLKATVTKLALDLQQAIEELRQYKKEKAIDCKVTMLEALPLFLVYQRKRVKKVRKYELYNKGLADTIPSKFLPDVTASDIDRFIVDYPAGQTTKANIRKHLSKFWAWACKEYGIFANPMIHVDSIRKDADKEVVAITDESLLIRYLEAHKQEPYWHTWVSMACLLGCSFDDLKKIKVEHIQMDYLEVKIPARGKTGVFRRCPLEQTYLVPILKAFIKGLPAKQEYLFVNSVGQNWAYTTWHKNYKAAAERLKKDNDGLPWNYGGDEWRHQGGTTMGHCGHSETQISDWMGNSPAICRKHYLAHIGARKWSFKYS